MFEYRRSQIERKGYPSLEAEIAAVNDILNELDADPERVKRLAGWRWIVDSLHDLSLENAA